MPNFHPLFVHFPIALLTIGWLFDFASLILRNDQLQRTGWWLHLSGTVGLMVTIVTGLFAKSSAVIPGAAQSLYEFHQQMAFIVAVIASALLLWRISSRILLPARKRGLYLFLGSAMVVLLWVGAWYGGELVYGFGVGVQQLSR